MMKCPICGNENMSREHGTFVFRWAGEPIEIPDSEWYYCPDCDDRLLPPKLNKELDRLICDADLTKE